MRTTPSVIRFIIIILIIFISAWNIATANIQFSISERTYKKLEKVERLITQKHEKEALAILEKLESTTKARKYELTLVYLAFGHVYYDMNRLDKASEYFEKCLALHSAPVNTLQSIRLNLIQTYSQTNHYNKAIDHFKGWLENEKTPSTDILAMGGILYAYIKDYDSAVSYLQQAINSTKPAKESWYKALLSIYYERKNYQAAITLLQQLVTLYPDNKDYWKQLFNAFYLNNNFEKALSTLQLAHTNNVLNEEEDIVNLAKLYISLGIPIKAIKLLNKELTSHRLRQNEDNLGLLASAYLQARETKQAALTYAQVARLTHKQEQYLLAARLFLNAKDWVKVVDILNETEANLDQGQAHLLKGIALTELNQKEKAIKAFHIARQHTDTAMNANQWLDYLRSK